jgi:8-oxo-dGTP pyrophosphatase MutT (NUDIX family)
MMREVKGYFKDFNGKRVWVPEHQDTREAAKPEAPHVPKNLKPVNMAPQPIKGKPEQKHYPLPKYITPDLKVKPSKSYYDPLKAHPKPKDEGSAGAPPSWSWTNPAPLPELSPAEKLAKFLKANPLAQKHPKKDEDGNDAYVREPSYPTGSDTWDDPSAIATWIPGGKAPESLNGVKLQAWKDHPRTDEEWAEVAGQDQSLWEPPFPKGKAPAAGVVIEEPDGRVWIIHPSNEFGGYKATWPKGHVDSEDSLQSTAIREAFEESGLKVQITGYLDDVHRTTTTARYYTAKRVGGTPTDCGWETQAVSLVPRSLLYHVLNRDTDHGLAEALGAGPAPKPEPSKLPKDPSDWWQDMDFAP